MDILGLHHVSALTSQAAENVAFYTQTLGLRLVKKTVNQDDTSSYHLFYGDVLGNPGTEVTFFDIPRMAATRRGSSSISRIALRVAGTDALQWWQGRFDDLGVEHDEITDEGGRPTLSFRDFEGQRLALVDDSNATVAGGTPWDRSPVPADTFIRGLGSVNLTVRRAEPTARVLTDIMGFKEQGHFNVGGREILAFAAAGGGAGTEVLVEERPDLPFERLGRGGVHHVAFRVADREALTQWLDRLTEAGIGSSGEVERYYFRSVYFREPNGILFELATDGPGFAADEDPAHLGERLALPPFLEPKRAQIEASLHPLDVATS